MSNINERLQMIVDKVFDGNKAQFAKAINIAPTSISNYLSDKRQSKPSCEMLERIINVVDGVSPLWLLTGKGDMIKDNINDAPETPCEDSDGRLLSIVESQQRIIELQASTIEALSKK